MQRKPKEEWNITWIKCKKCRKSFWIWNFEKGKRKFCSRECSNTTNTKHSEKTKQKMKGREVWNKGLYGVIKHPSNRGENNYFWKGGVSKINYRIRRCNKFKEWRGKVFKRDDWTCQECKERGGRLDPHHIKSLAQIIKDNKLINLDDAYKCKELWDINNGQTLCHECHLRTNTYGKH